MEITPLSLYVPDVSVNPTIQSAVNAAAKNPRGAVWIPASYTGTDSYTNPSNVPIFDLRGAGSISFSGGGGGFANPMTTLGDIIVGGSAAGVATRLPGPTSPNGVPQTFTSTPSSGLATAEVWALPGISTRDITGTTSTDTIVSTDCNPQTVNYQGSVSVTVTLPPATTLGVPTCALHLVNNTSGSSTTVNVVPTTWTVNPGSTNLVIAQGQSCRFTVDSVVATQWNAECADAPIVAGAGITLTRGQFGPTIAATGGVLSSPVTSPNPLQFNVDPIFQGPNPWVDIRAYGARSVNPAVAPAIPGVTASINSSSTSATLSSASSFVNKDGVVIFGAGTSHAMSTPGAPTVVSSVAAGPTGTGAVVTAPAAGTSYSYQIVARNKTGGLTAAGAVGSTAIGNASLGSRSVAITSCARSGTTVTCLTAAHTLSIGSMVYLTLVSDGSFGGWYIVATVPDTTHFTFTTGFDTASGAPASSTGGTVYWFNCNHLSWSAVTGAFEYYIYGRTGGSLTLLGVSKPDGNGTNNDGALYWDDFGSPMMDNFLAPYYVPTTPPGAATSNHLVTTIVSGASTTTLTLTNAAGTNVTNATILYDGAPSLLAAASAGTAFISTGTTTVVNSYLTLPSNTSLCLNGGITLNDTIEASGLKMSGRCVPQSGVAPSFGYEGSPIISVRRANPGIYAPTANSLQWDHVSFYSYEKNNARLAIVDHGAPATFSWINWNTGANGDGLDYMGVGLELRGLASDTVYQLSLDHQFVGSSLPQTNGISATPALYCNSCGSTTFDNFSMNRRGITFKPGQGFDALNVLAQIREQGGLTPLLTVVPATVGGGLAIVARVFNMDTMAHPLLANFIGSTTSINVEASETPSSDGVSAPPIVSGYSTTVVGVIGLNPGAGYTSLIAGSNFSNNSVQVNGTLGNVGYGMAKPAAPTVVVSAGGSIPVGTWVYQISALDVNGAEAILGNNSTNAVVTGGNQTVTITPPTAPIGSTSYYVYRHNPGSGIGRVNAGPTAWGVNTVDTFGFTMGPGGPFGQAIQSGANAVGLTGNVLTLTGSGFKDTFSGTFTANRTITVPDASGTLAFSSAALDCSIYPGADDSIKLQACFAALKVINAQAGIADGRKLTGLSWSVNPFAAANIPASGILLMPPGDTTVTRGPVVAANSWSIRGITTRSGTGNVGVNLVAGSAWPTTYSTGTVTMGTPGQSEVITGSGTGWVDNAGGAGNIAVGCAFVSPSTQPTAANSTYGIIKTITDGTHITLAYGANNGTGAPGGSTYVIYCPLYLHGDGSGSATGDNFGMAAFDIGFDCNNKAGCIPEMNWYGQQGTYADNVWLRNYCGIGFDLETSRAQNSGPWNRVQAGGPGSCGNASSIPIVVRMNLGQFFGLSNVLVSSGQGSPAPNIGIDVQGSSVTLVGVDSEGPVTAISVGGNTSCVPACAMPPKLSNTFDISNVYGSGTTMVRLSNAIGANPHGVLRSFMGFTFTNVLIDDTNGCTIPSSSESRLGMYATNSVGKIAVSTSAVAGCQPRPNAFTVAGLPAAAAGNAGQYVYVTDSTAIAAEGQTCTGGGAVTALAFSNGSVWKCF